MALRAGYYGLKNSVKKKLEKLAVDMAGAKIIKTIGDGLNLTSAGKLNVTAATNSKLGGVKVGSGLEIVEGVLNVTISGGFDYSTTEFSTGQKWIDGSDIYGIVYDFSESPVSLQTGANNAPAAMSDVFEGKAIIDCRLCRLVATTEKICYMPAALFKSTSDSSNKINPLTAFPSVTHIIVLYIKTEEV